jgi:hypothetical protein
MKYEWVIGRSVIGDRIEAIDDHPSESIADHPIARSSMSSLP